MIQSNLVAMALLFSAAPLAAQDNSPSAKQLDSRLGACLTSASAGAPRDSLLRAIVAVRSVCETQIRRVRDLRVGKVDERFGLPDAKLTASQQEALEKARDAAIRRLNDEIALTISNWTGLTR